MLFRSAAKQNFVQMIREKIKRNRSKVAALEYLEEFEDKFWCETDERVRDITRKFEQQINGEARVTLGAPGAAELSTGMSGTDLYSTEEHTEEVARYQRIVNETQLPRLNQMMGVLDEDILDSDQHFTYIVIDDLDRDWVDETVANALIRCLFRAVSDLKRVRNLKVVVALRTNIFEALEFGSKTGGQEEKFRSLTFSMDWTERELEEMLSDRAIAASNKFDLEGISSVKDLLPAKNQTRGSALEYILRRTLMRPRDAIAYFNEAFRHSGGRLKLTWDVMHAAELSYSKKRLLALRDEWKPNYPGLDRVFELFTSTSTSLDDRAFSTLLGDAALLAGDVSFTGGEWMAKLTADVWNSSDGALWYRIYHPLVKLLYDIGFIGMVLPGRQHPAYSQESPGLADLQRNIAEAEWFLVRPAFRSCLDISPAR